MSAGLPEIPQRVQNVNFLLEDALRGPKLTSKSQKAKADF